MNQKILLIILALALVAVGVFADTDSFDNINMQDYNITNITYIEASDWSDVVITESQISDLTHTTDTNANTICTGTTTYLDGEGNCDDISSVYEVQLNNEAGLYAVLSDVTEFLETGDAATLATLNTGQGANELYDMDQNVLTTSPVEFANITISTGCIYHNGSHMIIKGTC